MQLQAIGPTEQLALYVLRYVVLSQLVYATLSYVVLKSGNMAYALSVQALTYAEDPSCLLHCLASAFAPSTLAYS